MKVFCSFPSVTFPFLLEIETNETHCVQFKLANSEITPSISKAIGITGLQISLNDQHPMESNVYHVLAGKIHISL